MAPPALVGYSGACGRHPGRSFETDEALLAGIFVLWLVAIERLKPAGKSQRRTVLELAATLFLRELVVDAGQTQLARCLLARRVLLRRFWLVDQRHARAQEVHAATEIAPAIDDLPLRLTYRRNALKDAGLSAAFLPLMLVQQPNWVTPAVFRVRLVVEIG